MTTMQLAILLATSQKHRSGLLVTLLPLVPLDILKPWTVSCESV